MFKKVKLKNGLRIIAVPQKGTQAVTVLVLVGTGSKYEKKETSGISHFLEHMFFKGTKKRKDKQEIAEALDRVGGIYNAFTGQEYTGYFAKVDGRHLELALDWVSDIFLNSILPEKEVEKERGVLFEEINMYRDNPMTHVEHLWYELLYGDQPAGWNIAGTKESVAKISRQNLFNYLRSQYAASNTVVCIAGKVDDGKVISKAKKYFTEIRSIQPKAKPKVVEIQRDPQVNLQERKTDQTHLCLGVRGYNLFHKDKWVLGVIGTILGGMMSSRLFMRVREEMGLAYYIKTEIVQDTDTGFLVARAGVRNEKTEKAITAILKEYSRLCKRKISLNELNKAKEYIKGKLSLELEPSDAKAAFYGEQELLEKNVLSLGDIFSKVDSVSIEDVQRVSNGIFKPKSLNLALIGPFSDAAKFKKLLKI